MVTESESNVLGEISNETSDDAEPVSLPEVDSLSFPPITKLDATDDQKDESDGENSSDDSDVSSDIRGRFRRPGKPMPMVINIDDQENPSSDDKVTVNGAEGYLYDSIIYEAAIHNLTEEENVGHFLTVPVARYVSKIPFNPKVDFLKASEAGRTTSQKPDADKRATPTFNGCVFKIEYKGQARMPWLEYSTPNAHEALDPYYSQPYPPVSRRQNRQKQRKKSRGKIYNHEKVPRLPSGHDVTYWSSNSLVIKSPYLMLGLYDLITHWPKILHCLPTIDPTWEVEIQYPYSLLLHHYEEMGKFLDGSLKLPETSKDEPEEASAPQKEEIDYGAELDIVSRETNVVENIPELAREHLTLLYRFLTPIYEAKISVCKSAEAEPIPMVSFESLWYFFRPGTTVYVVDQWTPWFAAIVQTGDYESFSSILGERSFSIESWFLASDGATISRCRTMTHIAYYTGVKAITELDICPAEIWNKIKGLDRRNEAIKRGDLLEKAYRNGILLANYSARNETQDLGASGKVVIDHRRGQEMTGLRMKCSNLLSDVLKDKYFDWHAIYVNEQWTWNPQQMTIREGFSKDPQIPRRGGRPIPYNPYPAPQPAYDQQHYPSTQLPRKTLPRCALEHGSPDDLDDAGYFPKHTPGKPFSDPLTDEQKMLLYPLTFGFSLKTKVWIEMDASRLEEISATRESLDNLVIPLQTMKTIEALANRLKRQHTYSADHIAGKGSGGIILLHGPPGVGKTYTVEAIAEMLHRPLLALTVGDIGTKETMIEHELAKWFALAELWEAVLLIDEADIFLERRQSRDLQRNGLVSAFLRRAEYFKGLLFLTTNRVGQIDDAFISRVHVPIQYPDLQGEDFARIWEGFFKKIANDESINKKIVITPKTKAWVKQQSRTDVYKKLNGRDIRNALQTAITLAEFEHEEMSATDGQQVVDPATPEPVYVEREHFERVLNLTSDFHEYVDSIRRKDQAGRAGERGDRNDYLQQKESSDP